jgi:hypothetical protein
MQQKELDSLEDSVLSTMQGVCCSVRTGYPRGRYSKGFCNDEQVSINFTMLLALHNNNANKVVEKAI